MISINKNLIIVILILAVTINFISAIEETVYIDDYELNFSYNSADSGDKFTLTLEITNTGDLKQEIILELDSNNNLNVDDEEWTIGTLSNDESKTNTFRIEVDEDTVKGTYDLEFTLEDSEDDYEDEIEIEVSSDKADLSIGDISSTPSLILPDDEDIKLEITIENTGGGDAEFVKAELELPQGFESSSSYSNIANLGTIQEGENKKATFFINTKKQLTSGTKIGKLILKYETDSEKETQNLNVEIPIKGKPLFRIIDVSNSNIYPDAEANTLKITIQNIGEEDGRETSIRVFENSDQPFEFNEKTNFIGTIEKGKTGTANFEFDTDSDALIKEYLVKIQIRTVDRGNVIISEETIPIEIKKQESNFQLSPLILLFVLVILLLILIIIISTRKKKKSSEADYE